MQCKICFVVIKKRYVQDWKYVSIRLTLCPKYYEMIRTKPPSKMARIWVSYLGNIIMAVDGIISRQIKC